MKTLHILTLDPAKVKYRVAIDAAIGEFERATRRVEIHFEMGHVLLARIRREATNVINWRRHDWSMVGDNSAAAAERFHAAARAVAH